MTRVYAVWRGIGPENRHIERFIITNPAARSVGKMFGPMMRSEMNPPTKRPTQPPKSTKTTYIPPESSDGQWTDYRTDGRTDGRANQRNDERTQTPLTENPL